jgi:class 3 adenylate cyclase
LDLPPRAHEDDALRAVLARAPSFGGRSPITGLERGVGIATGRALCGSFGSDVRRDYMVRGDVINLAARLSHVDSNAQSADARHDEGGARPRRLRAGRCQSTCAVELNRWTFFRPLAAV